MEYVSDDYSRWDTEQEAKDADELYAQVNAKMQQFMSNCQKELDAIKEEFPHIRIGGFSDDLGVNWFDTRKPVCDTAP